MRSIYKILLQFAAIGMLFFASVAGANAASLHEACAPDLEKYCSNVTPGDGRIMACLYAHEDQISDSCDAQIADVADVLDGFLGTIGNALAICLPDIQKHCADTKLGQGRVLSCLNKKSSELTTDCKDVVGVFKKDLME